MYVVSHILLIGTFIWLWGVHDIVVPTCWIF